MTNALNTESMFSATAEGLPAYLRLISLMRLPAASGKGVYNEATLYHDRAPLRVSWHFGTVDCRLKHGSVVALKGAPQAMLANKPCLPISRLDLVDKPVAALNPFHTVPPSWVADRALLQRAAMLWERLSRPLQHLFNAVMWDGGRFHRFVTGPSSTADDLWHSGGNFRHCVEMAEQAANLARGLDDISVPVMIAAAFLCDAGKADDFRVSVEGYCLSERGAKVGYQHTILEWLAVARARVIVPEGQYLSLIHALVAVRNAHAGNKSIEAMILSVASRVAEPGRGGWLAHTA